MLCMKNLFKNFRRRWGQGSNIRILGQSTFTMRLVNSKDRSIILTCFLMKIVGIWIANNPAEQRCRNFAFFYTISLLVISWGIAIRDLYFLWGEFTDSFFIVSNMVFMTAVMFKVSLLYIKRKKFFDLVATIEKNFLIFSDDQQEQKILLDCKRFSAAFICFTIVCTQGTCLGYAIMPIMENIGKNESERILPFDLWIDFPIEISPYFEIMFVIQMLCVYHVGISYICYDTILCVISLDITGQFRILQHRLQKDLEDPNTSLSKKMMKYRVKLRRCMIFHQMVTDCCKKLEDMFTLMVLIDMLFVAVLLCVQGFQAFVLVVPTARRVSSILAVTLLTAQLVTFTYCWDGLIRESMNISHAVYAIPWTIFAMNKNGKALRSEVLMIITRSNKPCYLTAGGFFPVSLETCTAVFSTAVSYFTVLRNSVSDSIDT